MFGGRISSLIISLFVSIYIARKLGPEQYGTLNFIISFVSIAGFTLFAIDSLLIKKLNNEPENTEKLLGSALVVRIVNALATILFATIASMFFAHNQTTTILVLLFSTFSIFYSVFHIDCYFQSRADMKNVTLANLRISIISSIIKILLLSFSTNITYLLLSYVFDYFMSAVSYIYLYKKFVGNILNWKANKSIIKYFIFNSWPFTLSAIAATIYIRVDQIFLKILLGSKAVGLYVVAVRFSEVWFFISSIICASLLPAILNSQKTNYEVFISRAKRLYSFLFYISILICVFIFISAPIIIKTLYGQEYIPSILLLRIYIWSLIGFFISTALQQVLLAQNKFKTILSLNVIGMILSLLLNYILIPILGVKGAAFANIIAYTLPTIMILSTKEMRDQRKSLVSAIFKPLT